jgi:transcriptional regulator with XRE-family HTH domain
MPKEAVPSANTRPPGSHVGPYGRQPLYWVLRERGITQGQMSAATQRSTSHLRGVLNGSWVADAALVTAVSDFLGLPRESLFTDELLEASALRGEPRKASISQARRARVGRFGRQAAYWVLRDRRVRREELVSALGWSQGYISEVVNGSRVPAQSFLDAMAEFLALEPDQLFSTEMMEASRSRIAGLAGPPPSQRVGPHGRQPAYWSLRAQGVTQGELGARLSRSGGHVSLVLNGFLVPDRRLLQAVGDILALPAAELFTADLLDAVDDQYRRRPPA